MPDPGETLPGPALINGQAYETAGHAGQGQMPVQHGQEATMMFTDRVIRFIREVTWEDLPLDGTSGTSPSSACSTPSLRLSQEQKLLLGGSWRKSREHSSVEMKLLCLFTDSALLLPGPRR